MKLQSKVLLILASIWLVICAVIYLDAKIILENKYRNTELELAKKDIQRIHKAVDNILNTLRLYTISFSQWDDAYQFMKNKNERFIKSNFVPGTFTSSNINFFLYYNPNGSLFYGKSFNLDNNSYVSTPQHLLSYLEKNNYLVSPKNTDSRYNGILKIPEGLVVFSSMPILDSDGHSTPNGALFMGFYLTEATINELSSTVELKVKLLPLPLAQNDSTLKQAYQHLSQGEPFYIAPKNTRINDGYSLLKDINGIPIAMLQVSIPRDIYYEGIMTIYHYLAIFIILGIFILVTMMYLLKTLVLNRIIDVSNQVIDINSSGKFYKRIPISSNDEISHMVSSLNSMLELIELTQDQLKLRISRRTKDLEKLSSLNHNLFSEINKQKSIEAKLREDEKLLKQMAYYDVLTGLPNRAFFTELALSALSHAELNQQMMAICFLDIDKFKKINDTYGHDVGDKVIKESAKRIQKMLKNHDTVCRIAGDEYIFFITQITNREQVDYFVEQLFNELSQPMQFNTINIAPLFSIGISLYPSDGTNLEDLINQADLAMYYAKKREGNVYYYFSTIGSTKPDLLPR